MSESNPYHLTNEQLDTIQVDSTGRGHMLVGFFLEPLNPKGEAELRRIWDERPEARKHFAIEPPADWRAP